MIDYLRRHTAPLSERVWKSLDAAVVQSARHVLAGRRIATFDGPRGWDHVATRLGTMTPCRSAEGQAVVCVPDVVLMLEVRVDFSVPWAAVETLDAAGIPGPYEAVLPPARYYAYLQAVDDSGYPTVRQLRDVLKAVHRSPVVREGGAVFSTRGGDFVISVGGDLATGYRLHDRDAVHLFCVETLAPQTVTAEAVCVLES